MDEMHEPPDTEFLWLRANSVELHVVAAGPRGGPLALLPHGFPEFRRGWRRQIGPLVDAFGVGSSRGLAAAPQIQRLGLVTA